MSTETADSDVVVVEPVISAPSAPPTVTPTTAPAPPTTPINAAKAALATPTVVSTLPKNSPLRSKVRTSTFSPKIYLNKDFV